MTYFEFIDRLASLIPIDGKQVNFVIPSGGVLPNRPTAFELIYEGINEGRFMRMTKIIHESDAPEIFHKYFSEHFPL